MTAPWMTPTGITYMSLFVFSGLACFSVVPRARTFNDAELRYGLIGLLSTTGLWAILKTAFFIVPDPFREITYTVGLVFGFATVWAWLYFASAYTGRRLHTNPTLRRLAGSVFLTVVTIKITNPIHGLYFTTTEVTTPFRHLAINHGVIHWVSTGLAYVLAAIGLFMIFELYVESEYNTRSLTIVTGLLALPIVFDLIAIMTPVLIDFIYAPLGVAAFAVGAVSLFGEQLLAVRTATHSTAAAVIVDSNDRIRDFSSAAESVFPELEGAVGEKLASVLPAVAATRDSDESIIERDGDSDDQSDYYFVSSRSMTTGDSTVTVLALADITERERQRRQLVQRERELDQRNELYRAIMAASFAFIFRIDLEGRFSFVSPTVEAFLGYAPDELTGEPISVLASDEETFNEATNHIEEVIEGKSLEMHDHPVATRSGRTVYVDMRMVPIYEPSVDQDERTPADIVGLQVMVRDASKRRQREGLISVINRVLRHNVRNKMTVITGRAEMLAAELNGDAKSSADAIVQASNRLLDLTESARHIEENRELSPELEPMDIVPIISDVVAQLEERYPDTAVTTEIPETAVAETLPRIETALWELLENAAEHTGPEPTVGVNVTTTDEQILITIADEGPGFPEDERQVLADGKEEPLVHGQGLGLYLAYWIITNLDGEIEVPKSQSGTTITIRLPTASNPS
ncbi:PAS/PAC sensor signal transduction histidine kinase (plasmid) [Halorubrum lacusprofundi ATCC 49239]|uniref:PAS/PAC sensor signal transduction histidine kinase n=1 Tax=Halorubrum lacusprofundi (strain ATCC 49239 / DSM 5036 / JCM 8891 / ACAM 34) TaxID=416348 RepID=B9LXG5_HALLT|nr:ATP-binding protein [Halorubrum lacusprofundi]ACM59156.1 PAS/PAC sensor signal transduction histidine kinase [Halorubrum lacusprofundi ATCC 49239]